MKVWLTDLSVAFSYGLNPADQRRILEVAFENRQLFMDKWDELSTVSVPIAWFPRLARAERAELEKLEISPAGYGIHWPDIDEDISIRAFVG